MKEEKENPGDITTIQITKGTRDLLKNLGSKDETYDEIIIKLIGQHKATK